MAWALRNPDGEMFAFPEDWRELLDYVRLKSGRKSAIETFVKYNDGSHIRHVYGNLYVAFDCYDKQICVKSCSPVNDSPGGCERAWFEIEDEIPYPPDGDHFLEQFEFTGGWSAKWVEDLATLDNK